MRPAAYLKVPATISSINQSSVLSTAVVVIRLPGKHTTYHTHHPSCVNEEDVIQPKSTNMPDSDLDHSFLPALYKPAELLPIARHRESLLYLIETHPVTVVVGQTGSGKTTQIPQFLEKAGWCAEGKVIAVTQVGWLARFLYTLLCKYA